MKRRFDTYQRKCIDYEDDIVLVFDSDNDEEIYRGLEDYEPMKDSDWIWSQELQAYKFDHFIKICLDI